MRVSEFASHAVCGLQAAALSLAVIQMSMGPVLAAAAQPLVSVITEGRTIERTCSSDIRNVAKLSNILELTADP